MRNKNKNWLRLRLSITKSPVLGEVSEVILRISTLYCGMCDVKFAGSNF